MTNPKHIAGTRNAQIDYLRIVGALAIVFYHLTYRQYTLDVIEAPLFPRMEQITKFGYLAVNLFFMISGFVIFISGKSKTAVEFAISRIDRLYPTYWVAVTLTAISIFVAEPTGVSTTRYVLNLTMINDYFNVSDIDGVYWTLHVELKFYFCVFFLIALGIIGKTELFLWVWAACCVCYTLFQQPYFMVWFINPFYSSYFIAGIVFCYIWKNGFCLRYVPLLTISLLLSIYHSTVQIDGFIHHPKLVDQFVAICFIVICYLFFLYFATRRTIAKQNWFVRIGSGLTYALFLLHARIGKLIFDSLFPHTNKYLALGGALILVILLAYAVNNIIERIFTGRIKKIFSPLIRVEAMLTKRKSAVMQG